MGKFEEQIFAFFSKALIVIAVVVIGYLIVGLLIRLMKKLLEKTKLDNTAASFIVSVAKVLLYFIVAVTALGTIGVNIASLITALGAAALTAGLALQDCLSNMVSGLVILINKPFVAGDILEFEGMKGTVENIKIFSTAIHTLDNKLVTIPNSRLTRNHIVNCTMVDKRRVDLKYTVSYDDDITKVKSLIYSLLASNKNILQDTEPNVYFGEHLDSGIQIVVLLWVKPDDYYNVFYFMQENVKKVFDENGITIPYPHIVVKNGE